MMKFLRTASCKIHGNFSGYIQELKLIMYVCTCDRVHLAIVHVSTKQRVCSCYAHKSGIHVCNCASVGKKLDEAK